MINFFLQVQNDTIAKAAGAVIEGTVKTNEISVLGFILKGGFFLIPISLLLFYTFYLIIERYLYIDKRAKMDPNLIRDIRDNLNSGNLDGAVSITERNGTASGYVLREGILTIGRPISEIDFKRKYPKCFNYLESEREILFPLALSFLLALSS
jgi:biopolymer transport protein ExbB